MPSKPSEVRCEEGLHVLVPRPREPEPQELRLWWPLLQSQEAQGQTSPSTLETGHVLTRKQLLRAAEHYSGWEPDRVSMFPTIKTRKAISIKQPWTELILDGSKSIEVRTWPTHYRGRLWLHAGLTIEKAVCLHFGIDHKDLQTGGLLGHAELYDCIAFTSEALWEELRPKHRNIGPYQPGLWGWCLKDQTRTEFEPMKGKQGFMNV